ncbi:MAG: hypothetical protein Q9202_006264 [Teloschistes flavicans]
MPNADTMFDAINTLLKTLSLAAFLSGILALAMLFLVTRVTDGIPAGVQRRGFVELVRFRVGLAAAAARDAEDERVLAEDMAGGEEGKEQAAVKKGKD